MHKDKVMQASNQNKPELYPVITLLKGDDVAKILNISRSFAYKLMHEGEIPTIRMGRSIRVHPKDLDDYIASSLVQ